MLAEVASYFSSPTSAGASAVNTYRVAGPHCWGPPSSQPPLLGAGPLRTGRESFQSSGSGPSNAPIEGTRLRYEKTLAVNPVVALWMK
jgi:hypothetical protein